MAQQPRTTALTVWYDGDCPLCQREVALLRQLDRDEAITFVDLSIGEACPLDRGAMLSRFHAQAPGGELLSGAAAFAAMWRLIPALSPLGRLARWRPALWLMERLYRVFLRFRPALQALARQLFGAGSPRSSAG
ncbi:DUF393 domain-containing protein [Phenylobacterium sp.]|uniref:thiol-disulfide oxidoreductase DCC family protein n=1 Tax=Phenylobacterium sp. TaxID=1871053 RepID=UPI00286B39C1|nr:DUF393 domain-containing protein [Phenylobacterium sp.]